MGRRAIACVTSLIFGICAAPAGATLLAYEGFNYPAGPLVGQSGGGSFGFVDAWAPDSMPPGLGIVEPSLTDPTGTVGTSGGRVQIIGYDSWPISRRLASPIGVEGTTRYFSILGQDVDQGAPNVWGEVVVFGPRTTPFLSLGRQFGRPNVWGTNAGMGLWQLLPNPDDPVLLVLKVEFMPGQDKFTVYLNPRPGDPEPNDGISVTTPHYLGLLASVTMVMGDQGGALDEIRIGETFADVTPIPEPAVASLAAACLALMRRPRRGVSTTRSRSTTE